MSLLKTIGEVSDQWAGCGIQCMFFPTSRTDGIKVYFGGNSRDEAYQAAKLQESAAAAGLAPKVLEFGRVIVGHDMVCKRGDRIPAGYYWGYRTQRAGMSQIKVGKNGQVLFDSVKSGIMERTPAYKTFRTKVAVTGLNADMHWGNVGRLGRKFVLIDTGTDSHHKTVKQVRETPRPIRQLTLFKG